MIPDDDANPSRQTNAWGRLFQVCVLAIAVFYAVGLTRDMDEAWVGMYDGDGAFHSQLARNLLRYPVSVHHGMPLMAVGNAASSGDDISFDATQPPGLPWLMVAAFAVLGDAEWVARLVVVVCSTLTIVLLMVLLRRLLGREAAILGGLVYALMPIAVYGGRSVWPEVVCLLFMLAGILAWQGVQATRMSPVQRRAAMAVWLAVIAGSVWSHWLGMVYAVSFCVYIVGAWRRDRLSGRFLVAAVGGSGMLVGGLLLYMVYAGLEGHWESLGAVLAAQVGGLQGGVNPHAGLSAGPIWDSILKGATLPVLVFAAFGVVHAVVCVMRWRGKALSGGSPKEGVHAFGSAWVLLAVLFTWWLVILLQGGSWERWGLCIAPVIATAAAWGMLCLRNGLRRLGRRVANVGLAAAVVLLIHVGGVGGDEYRATTVCSVGEIEAWRGIHDSTHAGDRVLFQRSPIVEERYGTYCFRYVVPPQIAYYLDRSIGIEEDPAAVVSRVGDFAVFVWTVEEAQANPAVLESLGQAFPVAQVGSELIFDLRGEGGS